MFPPALRGSGLNVRALIAVLGLGLTLSFGVQGFGGAVYLHDGLVLHGKAKREMELMADPASGQLIPIVRSTNCFLLDDHARFVVFGHKLVASVDADLDIRNGYMGFMWTMVTGPRKQLPAKAIIGVPTPFDNKWERQVPLRTDQWKDTIKQKITFISPYSVRVESARYEWTLHYLTSELGPDVVIPLLREHPDIAPNPNDFEKQYKIFRFCTQAGWLTSANIELERLRKDFPNEKARLDAAQDLYRQLMLQRSWEEVDHAAKAGRHNRCEDLMKQLPFADLQATQQADAANLRARYETLHQKLELTRNMIEYCTKGTSSPIAAAIPVISRELNYDSVDRAETFTTLARQAEQTERNGQTPQHAKDQLLAALVSAWVLGPTATETVPETALETWRLRNQILEYQRIKVPADRKKFLEKIEQGVKLSLPQIAQGIGLLPPAESEDFVERPSGSPPMSRQTKLAWSTHGPFTYSLRLPSEYHVHRPYPVLIVLPTSGQSTADAMVPWEAQAARHGYILASVDWGTVKSKYTYSDGERAAALDCLRDLKRFLQVDPDRVFLAGFGEGANMAFDVGLSHPDLFAGIVPINGRPRWYASRWYWRNAQQLPFYMVCGELTNEIRSWDASLYESWADKGYSSLMVIYRGRINEFYPGEIPFTFDWMERKRRSVGFPELGRNPQSGYQGEEYQSFRESDNRFYWLSVNGLDSKFMLDDFVTKPSSDRVSAAMQASIRDNNEIRVHTRGVKQVSLWLGRIKDPVAGTRDMIDFSRPVKVTVNSTVWNNKNKPLSPKLETMLEDFHSRCDRNRLYMVRLDFDVK